MSTFARSGPGVRALIGAVEVIGASGLILPLAPGVLSVVVAVLRFAF